MTWQQCVLIGLFSASALVKLAGLNDEPKPQTKRQRLVGIVLVLVVIALVVTI
jgi:uncharacterized membrane protein YdcZ (DUF606 family)